MQFHYEIMCENVLKSLTQRILIFMTWLFKTKLTIERRKNYIIDLK